LSTGLISRTVEQVGSSTREPQLFGPDTIALMERLAGNLSFALEQLDLESAR
jgi:hypothetical protein